MQTGDERPERRRGRRGGEDGGEEGAGPRADAEEEQRAVVEGEKERGGAA